MGAYHSEFAITDAIGNSLRLGTNSQRRVKTLMVCRLRRTGLDEPRLESMTYGDQISPGLVRGVHLCSWGSSMGPLPRGRRLA